LNAPFYALPTALKLVEPFLKYLERGIQTPVVVNPKFSLETHHMPDELPGACVFWYDLND
jgi:hypothetical protein